MTDRLSTLLRHAADETLPPPAPSAELLVRGRRRRRRRLLVEVGTAVAAVLVIAVLAAVVRPGDGRLGEPAGHGDSGSDLGSGAVFSIGPRVYLDGGRTSARIDDITVKSLYYTSAGVLVRHGENNFSDGGGPQRFSLVRPDGSVSPVGVTTEETVHATDPDQPYLAYAQTVDGEIHVHVFDVDRDREVVDVPVPDVRASFLPVALDGDLVYLGAGDTTYVVDWRTGDIRTAPDLHGSADVSGGRVVRANDDGDSVIADATTGRTLLTAPTHRRIPGFFTLSPDGRYAIYDPQQPRTSSFDVYDVDTGEHVSVDGAPYDYGWTPSGDLFALDDRGTLRTCDPGTGTCTTTRPDLAVLPAASSGGGHDFTRNLQLGGRTYES